VVLATGGMAGPRRLNIPGEDLPHVSHYFPGPHTYFRTRLLVVGGRNSALEAALRCWRAGAEVSISYRRPAFDHDIIKPHLAMDMGDRLRKQEITFLPATIPVEITPAQVMLKKVGDDRAADEALINHEVDFVLLATGFMADMSLFKKAGVTLTGEAEVPLYNEATMETNVPGIYVGGTAAAGTQTRFKSFISTSHDHVAKIVKALTGHIPDRLGTVTARNNAVTWDEVKAN
jgi:thioredoxin reductase (NADPH)